MGSAAAAAMTTGGREVAPPLWPVEARLAALLPDLVVFRKPWGSKPELATAQGVLLGVHVTGEAPGRSLRPRGRLGRSCLRPRRFPGGVRLRTRAVAETPAELHRPRTPERIWT